MILSWEVRRSGFFSSLNSEERKGLKGSTGHWALGTARENMFFKFKFVWCEKTVSWHFTLFSKIVFSTNLYFWKYYRWKNM